MKISLVGSGNVAWHLGSRLAAVGHEIKQVAARNEEKAAELVSKTGALFTPVEDARFDEEDVVLVCVSDRALGPQWRLNAAPPVTVAHTAGAVPAAWAGSPHGRNAAFYPFSSFTRGMPLTDPHFPIFITPSDPLSRERLHALGRALTGNVHEATDDERARLHLAGVFVNNFVTYLLKIGFSLPPATWNREAVFRPILTETIEKALRLGPEKALTGPAIRGDYPTLQTHLHMLKNMPQWQVLYQLISELIAGE